VDYQEVTQHLAQDRGFSMRGVFKLAFGVIITLAFFQSSNAQDWGRIEGTVYVTDGTVATDATVNLVGLNYSQQVDEMGHYVFEEVPSGTVLLRVTSPRWGRNSMTVTVVAGETTEADIEVLRHFHMEEIVVSTGPTALTRSELVNPIGVLAGQDLVEASALSLGESLKDMPGISSTYFGPAISRPIIGGVGGSRVKILQQGVDTGDLSDQGPDHAVNIDAFDAGRIEIIRGPGVLLYGSNATGGVINILDGRVPNERPAGFVGGTVMGRVGSVADERSGGGNISGAFGNLVWRARALVRESGDISTPEFMPDEGHDEHAEEEHDEHGEEGHDEEEEHHDEEMHGEHLTSVENSGSSLTRGSFGLSWIGRRGYIGGAVTMHNNSYGVPGHAHHEEEHEEEEEGHEEEGHEEEGHEEGVEEVTSDLTSRTYDLEGAYRFSSTILRGLRFKGTLIDYENAELEHIEEGEEGFSTILGNDQLEGRLEVDHVLASNMTGIAGIQIENSELTIEGNEAYLPNMLSTGVGIFALERLDLDALRIEFAGRMQWQSHDPRESELMARSFSALSLSGGVNYERSEGIVFSLSWARAAKMPDVAELYARGLHTATRVIERGNENLEVETSNGVTLASHINTDPLDATISAYASHTNDFIYLAPTGHEDEGSPIYQMDQAEARISGVEVDTRFELLHGRASHLALRLWGDYVRGRLVANEQDLPRMPPLRIGAGIHYAFGDFDVDFSVKHVTDQERVFPGEEETHGYTMVNATAKYRLILGSTVQSISLQGMNLTNVLAREHTSFVKGLVPLPGRDIRLSYTFVF
jgi:iron complex outermembrane receptor protein